MPATVIPSAKHDAKAAQKSNRHHRPKKTRVVRRRGRGRDAIDSDDELEREARSDSGSDDEDNSSDSDSDDDGFSGSANLTKDTVVTPSTTQSPPPDDKPLSNGHTVHDTEPSVEPSAYKDVDHCWNAFDDENPWGPAPAEVNFDNHGQLAEETKSRRKTRNKKKKQQASTDVDGGDTADADPEASSSHHGTDLPPRGQSVRETYRSRLQDPSYVPTVGEFWGHDDRLLDKELRSLSGWWRGRWHKGRGGYSGRGGGGYHGGAGLDWDQPQEEGNTHPSEQQTWGHDGFEEMKKKEEQRRLAREQRQKEQREATPVRGTPFQRGSARGGRGGPIGARGRGFPRGGFSPSSPRPSHPVDRPWYAQKPERVWTKQLDGFLHFDSALKPRLGQGQGYRVKLAGSKEKVIRVSPEVHATQVIEQANPVATATTTADDITSPAVDNKTITIRLPKLKEKETSPEVPPAPIPEPEPAPVEVETVPTSLPAEPEESLDEIFTVKPRPVPAPSILTIIPPPTTEDPATSQLRSEFVERAVVKQSPSQSADDGDVKGTPQSPTESQRSAPPVLHPIRTVFTPVAPQPQTYTAPYHYPPHLPPGIAVNSHGITYEIATGRPVYLQPTPPPMYDPRPMMPPMHPGAVPFVPGHMHHLSGHSADFTHSRPHSISGYDPATGMALFSLPRQNSRIEIRRPDGANSTSPPVTAQAHRPSGLRTTVSAQDGNSGFQESQVQAQHLEQPSDYYPSIVDQHPGEGHTSPPPHVDPRSGNGIQHPGLNPNVMAYQPQPYPYYGYPDYGYPQYMDMSQMGYEMYPEPQNPHHNSQPSIYY